jgi:hypothetical protein
MREGYEFYPALYIAEAVHELIKHEVKKALAERDRAKVAQFLPPEGVEQIEGGPRIIGNVVDMEASRLLSCLRDRLRGL